MSAANQIASAFEDFDAMIVEGVEVSLALSEAASTNGVSKDVLHARLTRSESLESRVKRLRLAAATNKYKALLSAELSKARQRLAPYDKSVFVWAETIIDQLSLTLNRELSEHEAWLVEEAVSPYVSELKLASSSKSVRLRKLSFF